MSLAKELNERGLFPLLSPDGTVHLFKTNNKSRGDKFDVEVVTCGSGKQTISWTRGEKSVVWDEDKEVWKPLGGKK